MIFLVPSYKRAGAVEVRKWLKSCVLCVHEFEAGEYREKEGGEIAVIPDALRGNMARIRNWMLAFGYSQDERVVMLDDDVESVGYHEAGEQITVREDYFLEFLECGYRMAEDLGARLWGVNLQSDPRFYNEVRPIAVNLPVLGPLCCHIANPLRYDERLGLNEDYDLFLQHVHRYRVTLRFDKWFYRAGHLTGQKGGCTVYRNMAEERRQAGIMVRKWGSKVVEYREGDPNPIIRVPF